MTEVTEIDGTPSPDPSGREFPSIELVLTNIGLVILVGSIVWGVLSRYITKEPATWVEEVSSIAFTWVVFVGAAEVHRRGRHVSVDLLTSLFPDRLRAGLDVASQIFVAAISLYVAWLGLKQTVVSNSAHTSILEIPLSVSYAGLTFGFLMIGLRSLQRLLPRRQRR